jgi:glycosyltransferase involved in cell wall biosynthesis
MEPKKFLILLFYYNRPNLVKHGLKSILAQSYQNWEIGIVDDGSEIPVEPIVREMFGDSKKVRVYRCNDTIEDKMKRGGINGSMMGKWGNDVIENSDADYVVMLCDDDALYGEYLQNLAGYFETHPEENYVYSHIKAYNPTIEDPKEPMVMQPHSLNKTDKICPFYALDFSQISFRRGPAMEKKIKFPFPLTVNIDAEFFLQMHVHWGNVAFSGFIGQYKAVYTDNLSHRMGSILGHRNTDIHVYKIGVQ